MSPLMCGIVGYVGDRPCRDLLMAGLEKLEYRGYDSAGVSVITDGEIDSVRAVGNLSNLREALEAHSPNGSAASPSPRRPRRSASPTRAGPPTAGSPRRTPTRTATATTAIHIVLNGIVENHAELRKDWLPRATVQLRDRRRDRLPPDRAPLRRRPDQSRSATAFNDLRGHYAFVAMHSDHPDTLVAARKECPLIVGLGEDETFVASAIPAFLAQTRARARHRERRDRHHHPGRGRDHRR